MKAVKVQFRPLGKKYYFSPQGFDISINTKVVVNTIRGIELGYCVSDIFELDQKELNSELKPIEMIGIARL